MRGTKFLEVASFNFIEEAIFTIRREHSTQAGLDRCINLLKGHTRTPAFIELEISRFDKCIPYSSLTALLAYTFLSHRHDVVSIDVDTREYIKRLWYHVLETQKFFVDKCLDTNLRGGVEFFVESELFRYECGRLRPPRTQGRRSNGTEADLVGLGPADNQSATIENDAV